MKQPFNAKELPAHLAQLHKTAYANSDWEELIEACENEIDDGNYDDTILLCCAHALITEATKIYVDDVESAVERCVELLQLIKSPTADSEKFSSEIKRIQDKVELMKAEFEKLQDRPLEELSVSELRDLAHELQGSEKNNARVTAIYHRLFSLGNSVSFFDFGHYMVYLYTSNQVELAQQQFERLANWDFNKGVSAYPWVYKNAYYYHMLTKTNDLPEFQSLWNKMMAHEVMEMEVQKGFPYYQHHQDHFLTFAHEQQLKGIARYLAEFIRKERKPKDIDEATKKLVDEILAQ